MSGPSADVQEFRKVLQASQHIVVVAGAGLSAASGIPTFRDGGGLWRSLDVTSLATPEAFGANPSLVWQFYHYLRALSAIPNNAHKLLAKMSIPNFLKTIAPRAESYHVVTQNIDRLSVKALELLSNNLGNKKLYADRPRPESVLEMHGRLFDVKCTSCDWCAEDRSNPLCPALGQADVHLEGYHDAGSKSNDIPEADLPRCPQCGALARPGVVWFFEEPFYMDYIDTLILQADLCIIVGTSLTVQPAGSYMAEVQDNGGTAVIFNMDSTELDEEADFLFRGPCEVELLRVLGVDPDSI
ncbi:NAD-dependent deacetylase sirtuin-5 [Termitomyces sp. J132]|nr:NAD-dependent deacetylase sirtuin-5 [Termitomyces sp. J132]